MGVSYGNFNPISGAQTDFGRQRVNDFCIVKNGLVINLDAGDTRSYPQTGTIWRDLSPSANNGTLANGPTFNSANGGSVVFDGTDDCVNLPINSLTFGTGTFSLEAWVYPTSLSGIDMVYASQSSNEVGHIALIHTAAGSGFCLIEYDGSTRKNANVGSVAIINTWYHLVGIRNASNQYILYVNTVPTNPVTSTLSLTSNSPKIGVNPATNSEIWQGRIANFKAYNRALSEAEIKQNFNAYRWRYGL